jgi:hypothetical protein
MELPIYENKKEASVDYRGNLILAQRIQQAREAMRVDQRHATVTLELEHPALFCVLNDTHLFGLATDYEAFNRLLETIRKYHIYVISVGDLGDYYNASLGKCSQAMEEQVFSPEEQANSISQMLRELDNEGLLISHTDGNHEDFMRTGGITYSGTYLRDLKCPVMSAGGYLTLYLGQQEYKIVLSHRYRGNSRKHPAAPAMTLMEDIWPSADISIVGHSHLKWKEQGEIAGERKTWLVGGCFNFSDFKMRMGCGDSIMGGLSFALWPDKHMVVDFWNIEEAVELIR